MPAPPSPRARRAPAAARLGLALLALAPAAGALESVLAEIGRVDGGGFGAERVRVSVVLEPGEAAALRLSAARVWLPAPLAGLRDLRIDCPAPVFEAGGVRCDGRLEATTDTAAPLALAGPVALHHGPEATRITLPALAVADAAAEVALWRDGAGWHGRVRIPDADLAALWAGAVGAPPGGVAVQRGRARLGARLEDGAATLELALAGVAFSDPSGLRAAEGLDARLEARGRGAAAGWSGTASLALGAGQIGVDPVYLDLAASPLDARVEGRWDAAGRVVELSAFRVRHGEVASAEGALAARLGDAPRLERLRLTLPATELAGVYDRYLLPFLFGGPFAELDVAGRVALDIDWQRGVPGEAHARLLDVTLTDRRGRYAIDGLEGEVLWRTPGPAPESRIAWQGGSVYAFTLGAAELVGRLEDSGFALGRPLELPVLDGALGIERFTVAHAPGRGFEWSFEGGVRPISLEALTGALGWPTFSGTLSGVIPRVHYADGGVAVEGALLMRVFDGTVVLHNLRLERPFGVVPVLSGDVDLRGLSLDALTSAFSFGNIRGRLDGEVRELVLEDWRPRAFDARFATPAGDTSAHRISQRAVNNLTSLGGASGALSATFLRFFEEFSYDRLGLSCRLRNGVCEMGGVEPAPDGYFIVTGRGLPRIDVKGYNQKVDWQTLVDRLRSISSAEGPVIR